MFNVKNTHTETHLYRRLLPTSGRRVTTGGIVEDKVRRYRESPVTHANLSPVYEVHHH